MLFSLFSNLVDTFSFFNVFKYLTVRTGLSMFTSMIVVFIVGNPLINYFSVKQMHNPSIRLIIVKKLNVVVDLNKFINHTSLKNASIVHFITLNEKN